MNSGLYAFAGDSATATEAACANRLDEPMTNVSNMYFGLSRLPSLPPDRVAAVGPRRSTGARPGPLSLFPLCIRSASSGWRWFSRSWAASGAIRCALDSFADSFGRPSPVGAAAGSTGVANNGS
jgi:hypothetical protein